MTAIERLEFLVQQEKLSAQETLDMLAKGTFSPMVAKLMAADISKTNAMVLHLELAIADLRKDS